MPEQPELAEVKAAWLHQPGDETPVDVETLQRRRAWELFSTTRSEVLGSIGAALFFAGVVAWRFWPQRERLVLFGCAGVVAWAIVTLFRLPKAPGADAFAITGLQHYRAELARRRRHLRSVWVWHGPLCLACLFAAAAVSHSLVFRRLWDVLPMILVLAAWAAAGIRRRFRLAAEIQREIDEMKEFTI